MNATASRVPLSDRRLEKDTRALYDALSELIRVYQFRDRDRICCHDISITQCYALEAIVRQKAMTLNDLAAHLYLDKSTASRVVDALERKGYVVRSPHPGDGRALRLKITPAGKALHARIVRGILAEESALLKTFEPGVRRSMTQLILELARAAERRMGCAHPCSPGKVILSTEVVTDSAKGAYERRPIDYRKVSTLRRSRGRPRAAQGN